MDTNANVKLTERLQEIKNKQIQSSSVNGLNELMDPTGHTVTDDSASLAKEFETANEALEIETSDLEELVDSIDAPAQESEEVSITEADRIRAQAENAAQKYAPITVSEDEQISNNTPEFGDELFKGIEEMEANAAEISKDLYRMAEEDIQKQKSDLHADLVEDSTPKKNSIVSSEIDDIIESMGEEIEKPAETEQDLEDILKEYENSKAYSKIIKDDTEEITGPADYIIEKDEEYAENIEDILKSNNIVISKKNANEKNAILERFVNTGDKVSLALPNSAIYVTMSGAGTAEIIAMNSMDGSETETRQELNKLNHVCQHIVNSSIGKIKLSQLIKVISYWDKDSLYYALFAATHPNTSELSKSCDRCGREYFLNIHTKDMLLNAEDFDKSLSDIRDNVTTYNRLIETSELGKVYKKAHSNGMVVYYKHPSIESYLNTMKNLTDETMRKHYGLVDAVYGIDRLIIHDKGNSFIEIIDPNEILDIISKLKNADEKYEIYDMFESIKPASVPVYGFKPSICPHCGAKNEQRSFSMESILFTQAQQEEYEASLRWAVKTQKRKKSKKK